MLKKIPKEMTPELMKILLEMGHGDELVICDGNFPASAYPDHVTYCPGMNNVEMLDMIGEFFPLDINGEGPVLQMAVNEGDDYQPPTWPAYEKVLEKHEGQCVPRKFLGREEFYKRAKNAYAVVVTSEMTFYAAMILRKGTIGNG